MQKAGQRVCGVAFPRFLRAFFGCQEWTGHAPIAQRVLACWALVSVGEADEQAGLFVSPVRSVSPCRA